MTQILHLKDLGTSFLSIFLIYEIKLKFATVNDLNDHFFTVVKIIQRRKIVGDILSFITRLSIFTNAMSQNGRISLTN